MRSLIKFTTILLILITFYFNIQDAKALEVDKTDPYLLVESVTTNMFNRLKLDQELIANKPDHMQVVLEEELMPYIDYKFASFVVLGKHFKSVPREKLNKYVSVFRSHLIKTYSEALSYYTNQQVVFEPTTDYDEKKKAVTVKAIVTSSGSPDIKIAFKVRKDSKDNSWQAYDMVAEGISLLESKRNEFKAILRQEGIDAVISIMEK